MEEKINDSIKNLNYIYCYLCGREFGTNGYPFHYKQCIVRSSRELSSKLKGITPPSNLEKVLAGSFDICINKFNDQAKKKYKQQILSACKYCGRTFVAESLSVHENGCNLKGKKQNNISNQFENQVKIPKTLVCCVCGQQFGLVSLKIHYPECIKKFNNNEFRIHKKESNRRSPPIFSQEDLELIKQKVKWSKQELEKFNQRAMNNFRNNAMIQCDNCQRKFFQQSFPKHRKNCQLINGKLKSEKIPPKIAINNYMSKPQTLLCYICGREYGLSSLSIHAPQCKEKFEKQQQLKPIKERKQLPLFIHDEQQQFNLRQTQNWTFKKIQKYNKICSEIYNSKSLSKCYICDRTFFEESLPKHLKNCQDNLKDLKKIQKLKGQNKKLIGTKSLQNLIEFKQNKNAEKSYKKSNMLVCFLCGRKYGSLSLKIHFSNCQEKYQRSSKTESQKQIMKAIIKQTKIKYNIDDAINWNQSFIQQFNQESYEIYKKYSLYKCQFCLRTFFEESLQKHIKYCQKKHFGLKQCINTAYNKIRQKTNKLIIIEEKLQNEPNIFNFLQPNLQQLTREGNNENITDCNSVLEEAQIQSQDQSQRNSNQQDITLKIDIQQNKFQLSQ